MTCVVAVSLLSLPTLASASIALKWGFFGFVWFDGRTRTRTEDGGRDADNKEGRKTRKMAAMPGDRLCKAVPPLYW